MYGTVEIKSTSTQVYSNVYTCTFNRILYNGTILLHHDHETVAPCHKSRIQATIHREKKLLKSFFPTRHQVSSAYQTAFIQDSVNDRQWREVGKTNASQEKGQVGKIHCSSAATTSTVATKEQGSLGLLSYGHYCNVIYMVLYHTADMYSYSTSYSRQAAEVKTMNKIHISQNRVQWILANRDSDKVYFRLIGIKIW